jgi:hypothetical protein
VLKSGKQKEAAMKTKCLWMLFWLIFPPALHLSSAKAAEDDNAVKPFRFVVEPPTLINLGFEWYVEGNDNRNAAVQVSYRKVGDEVWKRALPMLRIQNEESIYAFASTKETDDFWATPPYGATNNRIDYITPNLFAGSILDLEPDTEYECRFLMIDPDGVLGEALETVSVRTRAEPKPFPGGKVYHVYPRDYTGPKNFYIADNTFIGRHKPHNLEQWGDPTSLNPYPAGQCLSEYAVKVPGAGHVICYNHIANFHDGIDHATYGVPDGYPAYGHPEMYPVEEVLGQNRMFVSNDIYNNFITNMHDDFIEVDGNMYNVRILRNYCINAAMNGLSSQTLYGGPAYFIRNIVYNVPNITKHAAHPSGMIYYHNTFAAKVNAGNASNYHFRNNLMLGWMPLDALFSVNTFTNYTSSDYNGFRPDPAA